MVWIPLAILGVVPLVLAYFIVIRSVDRYAPEPWWVLFVCFAWGAVGAVILSILVSVVGEGALVAALNPEDTSAGQKLVNNTAATFMAPLVEEPAKALGLLAIYLFASRRVDETHGPLAGMVYGGIIGLGFTLTEDILYIVEAGKELGGTGFFGVFFVRTVLLGFGHATFTALTGLGLGLWVTMSDPWRWAMPVLGLAGGMLIHAGRNLFGSFLEMEGAGVILILLLHGLVMALFFGLLVWLALRDRRRVMTGLQGVVGDLISREEYDRIINPWMLVPGWNVFNLWGLPGGYSAIREKQLSCFRLAFIRHRALNEPPSRTDPPVLDPVELEAITAIREANARGVYLAAGPTPPTGPPIIH